MNPKKNFYHFLHSTGRLQLVDIFWSDSLQSDMKGIRDLYILCVGEYSDTFYVGILGRWFPLVAMKHLVVQNITIIQILWAIMLAVFVSWSAVSYGRMCRVFVCPGTLQAVFERPWALLLSSVSHNDLVHFVQNSFTYWSLAPQVLGVLHNKPHYFLLLYSTGAICASGVSLLVHHFMTVAIRLLYSHRRGCNKLNSNGGSHGASGSLYAMTALLILSRPDLSYYLPWADGMVEVTGAQLLLFQLAADWLRHHFRHGQVDVAAHAGGALGGVVWHFYLSRAVPWYPAVTFGQSSSWGSWFYAALGRGG